MADKADSPEELPPARGPGVADEAPLPLPAAEVPAEDANREQVSEPAREKAKENNRMLDVHPAHHAANSWKEFFIHIATIVLGLLIAVGLEQMVELVHHRREVAQVRRELDDERETNRKAIAKESGYWRWEAVQLQNNLMVLAYLQHHAGTADEKLPGSLMWSHVSEPHSEAVWDAARSSGVMSLMDREEIEQHEDVYNKLRQVDEARLLAWDALNDASRYQFTDSRLSQLTPALIAEEITLTQAALNKHWLEGVALENMAAKYKDFSPSITAEELSRVHNRMMVKDRGKNPAVDATLSRMEAAGFGR